MQQRRLRPGDVLDDYCPRERRITDHAIVAMIDDTIQQTRCVVCDAEHEYKQAKIPAQRRKKTPALLTQVLDGLKAPARPPQSPDGAAIEGVLVVSPGEPAGDAAIAADGMSPSEGEVPPAMAPSGEPAVQLDTEPLDAEPRRGETADEPETQPERFDGPFRRQLIRAALPRPEGVTPPARVIPEFTIRQAMGRPGRHGRRRGGQGQGQGQNGPMRFGRGGHGQRSNNNGRSGGHGGPNASRASGSRRGGKKR